MPCLVELYLAENELVSLEGLENVPSLKKLHCRKNQIAKLQKIGTLPAIEYLNLRENPIENIKEAQHLKSLMTLKSLNIKASPPSEELGDGVKKEILILLGNLKFTSINKVEVTKEDFQEALEEKKERIKKEEELKLEAERLAKEQAEQKKEEEVKAE